MSLPKLDLNYYDMKLISQDKEIKYRPFLVKEEKILLMALESGSEEEMIKATKQILNNCIISENIEVEKLPIFDMQYIFLQLRSKSVGEVSEIKVKHPEEKNKNGTECKHITDISINLSDIRPTIDPTHTKKINLTSDVGVVMNYPTLHLFRKMEKIDNDSTSTIETIFEIMADSIDYIYQKDEIFYSKDHSKDEVIEFISSLNASQFNKIRDFFRTMPQIKHTEKFVCQGCGVEEIIELNGVESFFS